MKAEIKKRRSIIFDTNTLVSAAIFSNSKPALALNNAIEEDWIYSTPEMIDELKEVLYRSKFDKYLQLSKRITFIEDFIRFTEQIEAPPLINPTCRDPKDDKFLALALNIDAHFIITGDDDLLVLNPYNGTIILKANDYLEASVIEN